MFAPAVLRPISFAAALLASLSTIALAEDKPQTVDAGGLTFEAPATWKSIPASGMRRVVLEVPGAKDGEKGAQLIVFAFPGGAGGVDANVDRWKKTFKATDGGEVKVNQKVVKGKNVDVNRVEMAGNYHPTAFPGQAQQPDIDDARLLGAIVLTDETGYFIRLVGPDKLIKTASADFDKMIASMKSN